MTLTGKEVGWHRGVCVCVSVSQVSSSHTGQHLYTVGQRARIGGQPQPYFVAGKDAAENTVTVVSVCILVCVSVCVCVCVRVCVGVCVCGCV